MAYIVSGFFTDGVDQYTFDEMVAGINRVRPHLLSPDATLEEVRLAAEIFGFHFVMQYIPD